MATTEIEKLERRYAENPQGLTFAPLAEIYRKNGDTGRALELLQAGLELHPNYIPASIVLGRCHWDTGDLPAAEAAFSHVLRLDDENVIALKSLADITERLGRLSDAQRWLNRLLSIDRSNEEARQQLARVEEARQQPSPPRAVPANSGAPAAQRAAEPTSEPAPPSEKTIAQTPPRAETLPRELTTALAQPASTAASEPVAEPSKSPSALEFLDTSAPPSRAPEPPVTPVDIRDKPAEEPAPVPGLIVQEFVPPPPDAGYRSHPELTQEFASATEASDELEVETMDDVQLESSGAAEFRVPNAAEELVPALDLVPPGAPIPEPPAREPPSPPPQQAVPERKRSSYSVRETGGRSVAEYFHTMLASRPAGSPRPVDGASPQTTPDIVPSPPGVGGDQIAGTAAPGNGPGDVSFDDFFGAPAGEKSARSKGSSDPGKDDLDQFQSWLQNLKR
ncbi:MAG TPA: tetratricopeptide repeat protein [Gemmatimonadales bacterium]|nr:tetratricopeptide repeat protein [Gemmatimonadales bacterium]